VNQDSQIQAELTRLVGEHINWGLGLLYGKIRLEGHLWNRKRVYRNYKALNLHLRKPVKRKKIKRDNPGTLAATCINEGWSIDFLSDRSGEPYSDRGQQNSYPQRHG